MTDNQPNKLDELKDYLPADSDMERIARLIEKADAVQTHGSFLHTLDELCSQADGFAAMCRNLRARAAKELG